MTSDEAFRKLKKGFLAGQLAHAYAIIGPPRGEVLRLADMLLQLIFCTADAGRPCGSCRECGQSARHLHPDLWWVEPQKKSRMISVEQVRELQKFMFHTAMAGGWKACVLMNADRLGTEASNAFLKALEEPPPKSLYLLLTDSPQSLLATIQSRCQKVTVSGDRAELPEEWRNSVFEILATGSGGSAIRSLARAELLQRLIRDMRKEAERQEKEIAGDDERDEASETIMGRINARYLGYRTCMMTQMLNWHRDVLLLAGGGDPDLVSTKDRIDALKRSARGLTLKQALQHVRIVEDMNRLMEENVSERTVVDFGFSRLG